MNRELTYKAAEIINDHPLLITMVSKRVKQLQSGHSPLIELKGKRNIPKSDIALMEIIAGRIYPKGKIPKNLTKKSTSENTGKTANEISKIKKNATNDDLLDVTTLG